MESEEEIKIMDKEIKGVIGNGFFDSKKEHRYRLIINLENGNGKTLVAIMLNPSKTFPERGFDITVKNVIKIAQEIKYTSLIIYNLFSKIDPKSENNDIYKGNTKEYEICLLEKIKEHKKNKHDILVAWGAKQRKADITQKIIKSLKDYKNVYSFCRIANVLDYPKHPGRIFIKNCFECHEQFKLINIKEIRKYL